MTVSGAVPLRDVSKYKAHPTVRYARLASQELKSIKEGTPAHEVGATIARAMKWIDKARGVLGVCTE